MTAAVEKEKRKREEIELCAEARASVFNCVLEAEGGRELVALEK